MDIRKEAANTVREYYKYMESGDPSQLIKSICNYFDLMKSEELTDGDYSFLRSMSSIIGIPQYTQMLETRFMVDVGEIEQFSLEDVAAMIYESSLRISNDRYLHRYQKIVLDRFDEKHRNRFVLSAPTSFGKTFLVYEIIKKMNYKNVMLIFPTISLLSENYEKLLFGALGAFFADYTKHTLSDDDVVDDRNLWLFTPERFLSFCDKGVDIKYDFIFIDEIYKIDNAFRIEQEAVEEDERDVAYRIALDFACKYAYDMMLAGPYMNIRSETEFSFSNFIHENGFEVLDFNKIEIVNKSILTARSKKSYFFDGITVNCGNGSKYIKIYNILRSVTSSTENTIIYYNNRAGTERCARELVQLMDANKVRYERGDPVYRMFLEHIERLFGDDWIVLIALKHGIGIHRGLIPKYIQREIINLFNKGVLDTLISTTTITEGVNTSAKNIIITANKKGDKELRTFDAKNIAGRAGRFLYHYSGRVIVLDNEFQQLLEEADETLEHKNYDHDAVKSDVDYQITREQYLNSTDLANIADVQFEIARRKISPLVFSVFRTISPRDKILIYDRVLALTAQQKESISRLITCLCSYKQIDRVGLQTVINVLCPVIRDRELSRLIECKTKKDESRSLVVAQVFFYLQDGFFGLLDYSMSYHNNKDIAVRETARIVYSIFKYQLVKFLGVFDIIYRSVKAKEDEADINNIVGINTLIELLEHNAFEKEAQILNDYGVPFSLVDYYEGKGKLSEFDDYELYINAIVEQLIR